ncbi:nitric oxide-associated protein 1 [Harmonia axyridis]|uniref:nitric oxide-associated protein 1 n=1 Tax=Harmonia axyridis TaxID=115357 RepID=UPI001E27918B|nr:nitric oxide-associated protein 1 [Harmonia axyridis]
MSFPKVLQSVQRLEHQKYLLCLLISKRYRGGYTIYNTVEAKERGLERIQNAQNVRKGIGKAFSPANNLPISLKYLSSENQSDVPDEKENCISRKKLEEQQIQVQFPFQNVDKIDNNNQDYNDQLEVHHSDPAESTYDLMRLRHELIKEKKNWMLNYDNFDDTSLQNETYETDGETINYGTPDPKCEISRVPCGGCGAHLHCKDPSLPGYLPSEIFKKSRNLGAADLTALICQRCYFLKNHNIALEVQVSNDDYPTVLKTISNKKGIVVLMVDLTDFPCSIWPGLADIFHKMPILVVGNKVDLLPRDSPKYLNHVKKKLHDHIKAFGFGSRFLIDVILISATTGYGVEDLITKLHSSWRYKGDVYLVGSTNVGKSSLFNTLIQSDYCKSQAEDLIQRATTSVWPGTTLNLLKFPITKPSGHKIELRRKRLLQLKKLERQEAEEKYKLLKQTNDWRHAVLIGRIDRSPTNFGGKEHEENFSMRPSQYATGITKLGVNEKDPVYAHGRWCYDTPGVVPPDQILNLLTTEELFLTLPKTLIAPRSFCIRPGDSLFIGGLARLDYLEGRDSIWFTVFASKELPISLCITEEADKFYQKYLGTKYLRVPIGEEERLKKWPGLSEAKTFTVDGIDYDFSSKDVVLSNAGWISITGRRGRTMKLKAWTPEKRGVYIRDCLLPQAINLKGTRLSSTPAYKSHRYFSEEEVYSSSTCTLSV